jgi:Abnormal spindle-like microcephaly-assoc'd, ASPM-SPD-2-Hydin
LTVNSTTIAFGDVSLDSQATQSITLTSTGSGSLSITAASVLGAGFNVSGASFPLTLNPGQTATLNVEFDPTVSGAATGTLTIASNAVSNPTDTISLSGTGDSTSYEINLTWNPPTTSTDPVAGYNVYRSPSGGSSYQQINASVLTLTAFVDTTVEAGQTYDYIVESVDASGDSSGPSNMASVTTP